MSNDSGCGSSQKLLRASIKVVNESIDWDGGKDKTEEIKELNSLKRGLENHIKEVFAELVDVPVEEVGEIYQPFIPLQISTPYFPEDDYE